MTGLQLMASEGIEPSPRAMLTQVRAIPATVATVGTAVILGWILGIDELTSVIPGAAAMKFNTALLSLVLATTLQLRLTKRPFSPSQRRLTDALATGALILSSLTLVQFALGIDLNVDQIFFVERGIEASHQVPGRMNLFTAVSFLLLSTVHLIWRRRNAAVVSIANVATFAAALLSLSVLFGYLYGVDYFFTPQVVSPMAIHTAALLLLLSIGTTEMLGARSWLGVAWQRHSRSARIIRVALPSAILTLAVAGTFRIFAQRRGLVDLEVGLALNSTFAAVTIVVLILWLGHRMHRQEEELHATLAIARASEERFRLAAAATRDPIFELDPRSGSIEWSDSVTAMTGWTKAEIDHSSGWLEKVHPDDRGRLLPRMTSVHDSKEPLAVEYRVGTRDGRWIHVLSRRLVMFDGSGRETVRVIGSLTDISRQKELEGRLTRTNDELETRVVERTAELSTTVDELRREVERRRTVESILIDRTRDLEQATTSLKTANRELEAFAYSVSHDLRAPLRSLDGFSRILLDECGPTLDDEHRDYLQRIRVAAQKMGILIDEILKLSRVSRATMKVRDLDLSQITREIVSELRQLHPDHHVDIAIEENMVAAGDAVLVRQVLWNLLENAWKFTSRSDRPHVEVGSFEGPREKGFFVQDNGAGFDQAYVDKLFTAFQRLHKLTDFPGTGVGLTTVQRIVHRHGGRVWAEGAPDRGATFYFTLTPEDPP